MSFALPNRDNIPKYTVIAGGEKLERGSGQTVAHTQSVSGDSLAAITGYQQNFRCLATTPYHDHHQSWR